MAIASTTINKQRLVGVCALVVAAIAITAPASADTISLSQLVLNGTAELLSPNLLRLAPNVETNPGGDPPAGSAWTPTRVPVATPWTASFDFQMSDPALDAILDADGSGGDGLAFLIQNDPFFGTSALGRGAGGMGFLGVYNSVAVMFDTYQNNAAYGDPNGNYIAVNTRGTDLNVPHHFCTDGQLTTDPSLVDLPDQTCTDDPVLGMTTAIPRLDGPVHNATVTYEPGLMHVFLDGLLALSVPIDLASTISLAGGSDAFLGFTAGTRFSYQNHDILDFSYAAVPEPSMMALAAVVAAGLLRRKMRGGSR
jgi:hypothetical protein